MDDNGEDISTTPANTSNEDSSTANGTPIASASVVIEEKTITASYVVSNGQQKIVLEIPDHLQENYTYAVTARIEPTEAAYKYYMEHGSYARNADGTLIVGGTGTGLTSANANGFYVNQQAAVTYSVGGVEKTAAYENPVIQLQTVYRWNIFKVSANNYDYGLAGAAFTLVPTDGSGTTYYATSGDGTSGDGTSEGGTSGEAGKLTWYTDDHYQNAANYIAPGTYTLTETAAPAGYLVSNVEWTIIVGKDNDIQITKDGETINPDAASAAKQVITKTKTESEGSPAVVTYAIKFENEILYSLPSAGGEGIFRYLIAGMLLMMCGALLIFAKRRKILRI
jgi:LPXTG-motif cell wall-anchored protein